MNEYYVYTYCDPKNGNPLYVGKGKGLRAWKHHKAATPLGDLIRERVAEGFPMKPTIVIKDLNEDKAYETEIALIAYFGRLDLGQGTLLNKSDGGDGPQPHWFSPAAREKMAAAKRGKPNARRGAVTPESTRQKLREASVGKVISEDQKVKIAASMRAYHAAKKSILAAQ